MNDSNLKWDKEIDHLSRSSKSIPYTAIYQFHGVMRYTLPLDRPFKFKSIQLTVKMFLPLCFTFHP